MMDDDDITKEDHHQNCIQLQALIFKDAMAILVIELLAFFLLKIDNFLSVFVTTLAFWILGFAAMFTISIWGLLVFAYWWEKRAEHMGN
jgi:hypothetical protein